ncbi:LysR substrate-binding domain-containing protein [Salinisphaera aquimarina]|uniref:LysR substrate-binding domain-containing protein n=1 Tax=Salinisphaera aquimarina TaxID=2094031 RepID=A0ABV7EN39_9GAMM
MDERLPLNALRAFAAAARHESFKSAAGELHVTAGAISRQVKQLEQHLGIPLFERQAHGVRLNTRGQRLASAVDDALDDMAAAYTAARGDRAASRLTVSAPPSFIQHWLLPRLAEFEAQYADVEIALDASQRLTAPEWHGDGARLAIRYGRGPWSGVRTVKLLDDMLFPVCAPRLLAQGPPLHTPADLAGHRLLHVAWRSATNRAFPGWREWLDAAGAPQVDASAGQRYSLFGLALDQAIAGRGVALASSVVVADRLASGVLVAPFDPQTAMASPCIYDLLLPLEGEAPAPARAFIDWLIGEVEAFGVTDPVMAYRS